MTETTPDEPPDLRLPLKLSLRDESLAIHDAFGTSVCIIFYDDGCPVRRSVRNRLTKAEAIKVGRLVARALTGAIKNS